MISLCHFIPFIGLSPGSSQIVAEQSVCVCPQSASPLSTDWAKRTEGVKVLGNDVPPTTHPVNCCGKKNTCLSQALPTLRSPRLLLTRSAFRCAEFKTDAQKKNSLDVHSLDELDFSALTQVS